jgi:hypothetical protein
MNHTQHKLLINAPIKTHDIVFKADDYKHHLADKPASVENYVLLTGLFAYNSDLPGQRTLFTLAVARPSILSLITYITQDDVEGCEISGICSPEIILPEVYKNVLVFTYFSDYRACLFAKEAGFNPMWDDSQHSVYQIIPTLTRIRPSL